jgi:hypothetical protein
LVAKPGELARSAGRRQVSMPVRVGRGE